MTRIGLIVRCDDRGLSNQTWEIYRNLPHEKTLVVRDPGSEQQGFKPHLDRYPNSQHIFFDRYGKGFNRNACEQFLDGLDIVYSAETFYDWRFCDWARRKGVKTVLHVNPEFYFHWREPNTPQPDFWWSATNWRIQHLPSGTQIVPMPAPVDRFNKPDFSYNPRKVMHVGGLEAIRDRNGTQIVRNVAHAVKDIQFIIHLQDNRTNEFEGLRKAENWWDLYNNDCPVMFLPRKYGGLCLPVIEAVAAGKLVVMSDVEPNRMWPCTFVPGTYEQQPLTTQGGDIPVFHVDIHSATKTLKLLFSDADLLEQKRREAYQWALNNSWENQKTVWLQNFESLT